LRSARRTIRFSSVSRSLFKLSPPVSGDAEQFLFDVSDDGQHFLLNRRVEDPTGPQTPAAQAFAPQLTVVVNWPSLLTK
jgi:hypothetical protein